MTRLPGVRRRSTGRTTLVLALALFCLAAPSVLASQTAARVGPGTRVRGTTVDSRERWVGQVEAVRGDTLLVSQGAGADTLRVPLARLAHLDVSHGSHYRGRKAVIGGLIGLAAAGALALGTDDECTSDSWVCPDRKTVALVGGTVFGVAGLVVGALLPPGERWVRMPADVSRLRVGVARVTDGVALGVSAGF